MIRPVLAVLLLASATVPSRLDVAECLTLSLYHAMSHQDQTRGECCGECGGKGVVLSGDGISWVACPCPDDCECKKDLVEHPPTVIAPPATAPVCSSGRCKR